MCARSQGLHIFGVVADRGAEDQFGGVVAVALGVGLVQGEQQPVGQLVTQKGVYAVHGLADELRGDGDHDQATRAALAVSKVAGLWKFGCPTDHKLGGEGAGARDLDQAATEEGLDLREIHAVP